jgi:ABC-type polysaccharide/polyol phosphate transport system ATPase subunit
MTVASSSSSEPSPATGEPDPAPEAARRSSPESSGGPLIQAEGLGIWYRLHKRARLSPREFILSAGGQRKAPLLWALRDVGFSCGEGQTVGVVGPNGAGKSTLCLVLARILTPDEGAVTIRGEVSPLLTLGAGFSRDLSGRANIQLCGAFLGMPRKAMAEKIDRIVEFSELGEFIDEPIRHYSSGMRARLGFSVAAALDPDILILDEVLAVGDRSFRAKSQRRLEEMMAQSRLIVIVSHSTGFLREICTHCLWLDRGRVVEFGEAAAVLDAYEQSTGGVGEPDPRKS